MGQKIASLCTYPSATITAQKASIKKLEFTPCEADCPVPEPEKLLAEQPLLTPLPLRKTSINLNVPGNQKNLSLKAYSNKSHKDINEGSGSIFDIDRESNFAIEDFTLYNILGVGDFGKVFLARYLYNDQFYAIKVIKKRQINVLHTSFKQVLTERQILACCSSLFVIKMFASFQDNKNFYFLLEYISAGNLRNYIRKMQHFNLEQTRFLAAEILLGLQYLHQVIHVMHRDLKPENILIDSEGHIKLTDFALAKIGVKQTYSFCGTKCYFPPELITNKGYDYMVDYWTLGCLVFEMLVGRPPFYHSNQNILYNMILTDDYNRNLIEDDVTADFISRLLEKNPATRLGSKGIQEIISHPFFESIDFEKLSNHELESPLKDHIVERKAEAMINQQTNMKRTISNQESLNRSAKSSANNSVTSSSTNQMILADMILKMTGPDMMRPARKCSKNRLDDIENFDDIDVIR
jgi:serine/threonine protein kinase